MNLDAAFHSITNALRAGGIAVVRTDTIYAIIALASDERAVEKVYEAKQRDLSKQCIVLLTDPDDVPAHADIIERYSERSATPTSVIVPATDEAPWLLRGGNTMAYRVVRDPFLRKVVDAVGPVIAPSANPEGKAPARTIEEARAYFGDGVDVYVDGGTVSDTAHASQIVQAAPDGTITFIRS